MGTPDPRIPPLPPPETPKGVQPGGEGVFVRMEIAWGRLRRAYLRRFRPGHVARWQALRQGDCSDCPHDFIDPRDLKYVRNVCGHWYRPEDDVYRAREHRGFARYGYAELIGFGTILGVLAVASTILVVALHWAFAVLAVAALVCWLEVVWFFRDPRRAIPTETDLLLSPADGTVTHAGEVDDPDFPGGRALRVSIFLSVFNVHVNRLPRSGRVTAVRYFRGAYLDARHHECAVRNEQLWLDLEEPNGRRVRVKQIAGAIARRIVCWLKPGDEVTAGERYGMIKFGSRTDVLVPVEPGVEVLAKVGDKVRGGVTVLMRYTS
jgi:phosphatidylserine decarboxylase